MKNKFVKLLAISAVIFGSVSCKDEVAAIGQKAPDIAAYDLQGKEVKLDYWKGTRLLTFWSETCGRCVAELKEFEKLAEAKPNKIQLIAINVDGDKVDTKAVVAKRQLTLPVIKDQLKITAERYQLIGTPTSFVITPEVNFQAKYEGAIPAADLDKLFKNGFSTGHGHLREPNDIMSYSALAAIAIQSNQNDQHGGQSIPAFDYYLAPGVLKTFKKMLKTTIKDYIDLEDLIAQEDVVVTLSHEGYVKYQPLTDYEAQRRGGKGKSATKMKDEDFIEKLLVANTHDTILCFSSRGRLYWLKVYQLPQASRGARGRPIVNILPLQENERITAILPISAYEEDKFVIMATAGGIVKKIALTEFSRPRSSGIIALNLRDEDELIGVDITDGSNEIMLFSSQGRVVRFAESAVRAMGRLATGVRGIKLALTNDIADDESAVEIEDVSDDNAEETLDLNIDKVVSLVVPKNDGAILTATQNGYGKRTQLSEYPTKSRNTKGVISIKVSERNGKVVAATQVEETDQIMLITDAGTLVRTRVSEVSIVGRNTQGVRLIRTAEDEQVVSLERICEPEEDDEIGHSQVTETENRYETNEE